MSTKAITIESALFSVLGKDLRIVATSAFDSHYDRLEKCLLVTCVLESLSKHPVDMLVVSGDGKKLQVRSAGYRLGEASSLDEDTIVFEDEQLFPVRKFWFRVDDYGEYYMGTLLFPEDY